MKLEEIKYTRTLQNINIILKHLQDDSVITQIKNEIHLLSQTEKYGLRSIREISKEEFNIMLHKGFIRRLQSSNNRFVYGITPSGASHLATS